MTDTVLVTGADGFVGQHLTQELVKHGNFVLGLDKSFRAFPQDGVDRIEADILDTSTLNVAMQGVSTVYHLAAYTGLWAADKRTYQLVNVEGTHTVLRAALNAGVKRFVHCSSFVTAISGPRNPLRPIDEKVRPNPARLFGAYAQSKARAEAIVDRTANEIETVTVMPSAPLGPGDNNLTAPTKLVRDLINGKIPATLKQLINFVDVRLLAKAIASAGTDGRPGERYLLVGENIEMQTFLTKVEAASGIKMPKSRVPYLIAALASTIEENLICPITKKAPKAPRAGVSMAGRKLIFKGDKAVNDLDFKIEPIDGALKDSLLWLRENGHLTRPMPNLKAHQG